MRDRMIRGLQVYAWDRLARALSLACLQAALWQGALSTRKTYFRGRAHFCKVHTLWQCGCGLHLNLWSLRNPLLQVAEKVAAVLEYACHNAVEPFLEPVLELSHTIVQRDVAEIEAGGRSGGALTSVFLDQVRALAAAAAAAYLCANPNMLQDASWARCSAVAQC